MKPGTLCRAELYGFWSNNEDSDFWIEQGEYLVFLARHPIPDRYVNVLSQHGVVQVSGTTFDHAVRGTID